MPERPWLKLYVQDLLGNQDLARCSIGAFGLWVKILCHAYPHGGYLTFDDATPADGSDDGVEETARLLGLNPGEFRALRDELFAKKVARRDKRGVLYSGRMVRDAAKSAVRADAGRAGGLASQAKAKQTGKQTVDSSSKPKPKEEKGVVFFDSFWRTYPKKKAKPAARRAWKAGKCDALINEILANLQAEMQTPDWMKEGGQFIPYPASYLNDRRWEDGPTEVARDLLGEDAPI